MRTLLTPMYFTPVHAGFPSPAEDFLESKLDLNAYVIEHPAATYFLRVEGDSMIDAHIVPGDILVVDKALEPRSGDIVVACMNGEFVVKLLRMYGCNGNSQINLVSANKRYHTIRVFPGMDFEVWGVVKWVIHKTK